MIKITYDNKFKTSLVLVLEKTTKTKELELILEQKLFTAKMGEVFVSVNLKREGSVYLGLEKGLAEDHEKIRTAGFTLAQKVVSEKISKINLDCKSEDPKLVTTLVQGLLFSNYNFEKYKTKKNEDFNVEVSLLNATQVLKDKINELEVVINGVNTARDLVNTRAIDLYPETYAAKIVELFKDTAVEVEVFAKKAIEKLGMHALLAVNAGSDKEPRFVVMKYFGDKTSDKHITFVGKGLTYDSGGYDIKPGKSMFEMFTDMAGSAAVIGAIKAIADNKLKANVVAVTALTENLINGKAYKNGDIISTMKGSTVEIGSTDAEGRLTLADAIYYAATKLNSTHIIELSTLTGACVVALGTDIIGVTTNNEEFYNKVFDAGNHVGEPSWRLPVTDVLKEAVKGEFADLKNSVPGGAGTITAGIFLEHFSENIPFVHLDIAGTAYGKAKRYYANGATGVGVRTLYKLVATNFSK
ncbi:MAG: Cytosol aminopeptidase [Tenericutes bacterium ADurb.Bin087]|nr:MAG: Cytosol aminopeptidase [Tenericutes bacterium ADurb.Bin087]